MLESEGPRLDAEVFARLAPEDVALVREALGEQEEDEEDLFAEGGFLDLEEEDGEDAEPPGAEIARLQEEVAASRRVQAALERYLAALDAAPG